MSHVTTATVWPELPGPRNITFSCHGEGRQAGMIIGCPLSSMTQPTTVVAITPGIIMIAAECQGNPGGISVY